MSAQQWIGYLAQARLTISKMSSDEGCKKSQKVPTQWKWHDDVSQGSHCEAWSQWWQELLAQGQWERLSALLASSLSGARA
ncbi:hypothetical protein SKAU_G00409180 [Synaphobranchus kaupii]|uniref:Uncharacterized protein n=1 Tax=Synaphobranchus kaupii TaxID=118154 RepID=A0A9Q1ID44_SYNKA|nr:hypothetical protein SKAU_G00409180 [Synaphobranchus kaupii]